MLSIHHNDIEYFSLQSVLHNWYKKGCGMFYPVCGMVHIKDPLLLIKKRTAHVVAAVDFSRYFSEPLPYVQCCLRPKII